MSWKDEAKQRVKDKKEGATMKLLEGQNGFRILPNKKDLNPDGTLKKAGIQNPPFLEARVHRDVGPDKAFLRCGHSISGEGSCHLCDKIIPALEASGSPQKQEQADNIGPREVFLIQVSRIDNDSGKFGLPKPFWVSNGRGIPGKPGKRPSLATQVQSAILNSRKDYVDPVSGYNMWIERTGFGYKDTVYGPPEGDTEPSKVPLPVLMAVKPLEELIAAYDEEEMKNAYLGRPREDRESQREEQPRRRTANARPKAVEEVDDREQVEEAPPADDAYDEAPPDEEQQDEYVEEAPLEEEAPTDVQEEEQEEYVAEPENDPEPPPPPARRAPAARPLAATTNRAPARAAAAPASRTAAAPPAGRPAARGRR